MPIEGLNNNNSEIVGRTNDLLNQRACGKVHAMFGVNTVELDMLRKFAGYVERMTTPIVSKKRFFDFLSGNSSRWRKYEGYLQGLLKRGMLGSYEYAGKPDSVFIGLSELGDRCLTAYYAELALLAARFPVRADRRQRIAREYGRFKVSAYRFAA